MDKFTWGKVIDKFSYDFDGNLMEVVKYHPWIVKNGHVKTGNPDFNKIEYHCADIHESSSNLYYLIISWIANKNLGLNQDSLVIGIAKALGIFSSSLVIIYQKR